MIRCSHCGKLAPTGAMSCQHCGMPLVSGGNGAAGAGESEQQELPAWLESLRAHERPVPGTQENRQPFSSDELVDENSMPSWMRQDRQKEPRNGNSDSLPVMPVVQSNTEPEKAGQPSMGFQAGSLIDERSLPSWMRESQGQTGGQPTPGQNVQAHSLIDQQNLPPWMRDLGKGAPQPGNSLPGMPPQTQAHTPAPTQQYNPPPMTPPAVRVPQTPPEPPPSLGPGFSAHDLLDAQAMPGWMSNAQGPGTGPQPTRPASNGQGFSAGELVDPQAMPSWMRDLQGQGKNDPQSAMGVPVNGLGQTQGKGPGQQGVVGDVGRPANAFTENPSIPSWLREIQPEGAQGASGLPPAPLTTPQSEQGFAANSLLDANSLPSWMREGPQSSQNMPAAPQNAQGFSANSLLDANSLPSWMREGTPGGSQTPQAPGQGMSAGSLIDPNAMPAWMRNSDLAPQQNTSGRHGQAPGRPVPSRPRGESAPQEQSEVAANVFSAMLGVSASTPALPGQEATPPGGNMLGVAQRATAQPAPPPMPPQQPPSMPGWQQAGQNQYNQGGVPQNWQSPSAGYGSPYMSPTGRQGNMGDRLGGTAPAEPPPWTGSSVAERTALGVTSNPPPATDQGRAGHPEPKKKGFFDSIRDFFSK